MQIERNNIIEGNAALVYNVRVSAVLSDTGGRADKEQDFWFRLSFADASAEEIQYQVLEAMRKAVVAMGGGYVIRPRNVTVKSINALDDQGMR